MWQNAKMGTNVRAGESGRERESNRKKNMKRMRFAAELLFLLNIYVLTHARTHTRALSHIPRRTKNFFSPRRVCFNCTLLKVIKSVCAPQETHQCHFVKVIRFFFAVAVVGGWAARSCFCFGSWLESLNWKCTNCRKCTHCTACVSTCYTYTQHAHTIHIWYVCLFIFNGGFLPPLRPSPPFIL